MKGLVLEESVVLPLYESEENLAAKCLILTPFHEGNKGGLFFGL